MRPVRLLGSHLPAISMAALFLAAGFNPSAAAETTPAERSGFDAFLGIHEIELENGFRLLVIERPDQGSIEAGWVVAAGSADEESGATGVAHLLEHALFDGTWTVGALDPDRERSLLTEEDRLHDLLRRARLEGSGDPASLDASLSRLAEEHSRLAEPQALTQLYAEAGGRNLNASTVEDLTLFYVTLPAESLELWFWLESDRLLDPVFRAFYSEREIVAEERRQRIDANPTGEVEETLRRAFWGDHPYGRSSLGTPADVANLQRSTARSFFRDHYRAGSLTAVLIGPVESDRVEALAERYFGRLVGRPAIPDQVPVFSSGSPRFSAGRQTRVEGRYDGPPLTRVLYPTVPVGHPDEVVLDVLLGVLNGRSGRLHRELVLDGGAIYAAYGSHRTLRRGGQLSITLEGHPGVSTRRLLESWDEQRTRLVDRPVPAGELQATKNRLVAERLIAMKKGDELLKQLLVSAALGDHHRLERWNRQVQAVTVADLLSVARRYLLDEVRTVGYFGRDLTPVDAAGREEGR